MRWPCLVTPPPPTPRPAPARPPPSCLHAGFNLPVCQCHSGSSLEASSWPGSAGSDGPTQWPRDRQSDEQITTTQHMASFTSPPWPDATIVSQAGVVTVLCCFRWYSHQPVSVQVQLSLPVLKPLLWFIWLSLGSFAAMLVFKLSKEIHSVKPCVWGFYTLSLCQVKNFADI